MASNKLTPKGQIKSVTVGGKPMRVNKTPLRGEIGIDEDGICWVYSEGEWVGGKKDE
jgi:hypothetical protein